MAEVCGDNRFEVIEKAKKHLIEATNISGSPEEMKEIDNFLYRCWQMGWLKKYDTPDDGVYAEFFAVKDGVRYDAKVVNMKDIATTLTNSLMNGFEKLWE